MILQVTVALPVLVAALLAAAGRWLPRAAVDLTAAAAAAAVTVLTALTLLRAPHRPQVAWLGGWGPGTGVGIPLAADPLAAGLACVAAVLTLAALAFSWRYLTEVHAVFHALTLLLLASMCAFVYSGDLLDAFVFFQLMSIVAVVLTAHQSEEPATVHGALNFGIVQSLGTYLTFAGIALVYGRTGEPVLARAGAALARPDAGAGGGHALITAAFVLICTGYLVKAAAVPFHFWVADAHAVAPTPVCILFSGVMVQLGVYGVARTYWAVFAGLVPLSAIAAAGAAAVLLGAVMCLLQQHIKRLLAYATVSEAGLLLVAVALGDGGGLAGAAYQLVGHAAVKGALFVAAGMLLNRHETLDARRLRGRGRGMPVAGALFLLGGLCLAGLPPGGIFAGRSLIGQAALEAGWWWFPPLSVAAAACTAGAVLRVWLVVWRAASGDPAGGHDGQSGREDPETGGPLGSVPWKMITPGVVLLGAGLASGLLPGGAVADAAARFADRDAYAALVLDGRLTRAHPPPADPWTAVGFAGFAAALPLALAIALTAARRPAARSRPPSPARGVLGRVRGGVSARLHALHSGHIGDYAAWLTAGVALLALLTVRR